MKKKLLSLLLVFCLAFVPASIVPVFAEEKGMSKDDPFTTIAEYNAWLKSITDENGKSNVNVYVKITGGDFDSENDTFHIEKNVQNWQYPPKLHLTLIDCEFTGNTSGEPEDGNPSFMYLPNCQELVINGCTFDTGDTTLKYGINWNLCGIQNSEVTITNCTFKGTYEKNAIKLNQRNGADDVATDIKVKDENQQYVIPSGVAATIASAEISGCTFDGDAIIQLGSQGKGESNGAAPSTGNFPITIEGNKTAVKVELAYAAAKSDKLNDLTIKLAASGSLDKDKNKNPLEAVISVSAVKGSNNAYYVKPKNSEGKNVIGLYSDADCNAGSEIEEVPKYTPTTRPASTTTERSLGYRLPMITKEQKGFDSDTTQNFTVNGKYQFRITSLNGQVPVMTCGNNAFTVELASQEGNDYFFVIRTAVPGSTGTIYVNGYYLLVAAAA